MALSTLLNLSGPLRLYNKTCTWRGWGGVGGTGMRLKTLPVPDDLMAPDLIEFFPDSSSGGGLSGFLWTPVFLARCSSWTPRHRNQGPIPSAL